MENYLLDHERSIYEFSNRLNIRAIAERGQLNLVKRLYRLGIPITPRYLRYACEFADFEAIKFARKIGGYWENIRYKTIVKKNYLHILRWMDKHDHYMNYKKIQYYAIKYDRPRILKWLNTELPKNLIDVEGHPNFLAYANYCEYYSKKFYGTVDAADKLIGQSYYQEALLYSAIAANNIEVVKFLDWVIDVDTHLIITGKNWETIRYVLGVEKNHESFWVFTKTIDFPTWFVMEMAENGGFIDDCICNDIFKPIKILKKMLRIYHLKRAIDSGNFNIFRYIFKHVEHNNLVLDWAIEEGRNLEIVKYVEQFYNIDGKKFSTPLTMQILNYVKSRGGMIVPDDRHHDYFEVEPEMVKHLRIYKLGEAMDFSSIYVFKLLVKNPNFWKYTKCGIDSCEKLKFVLDNVKNYEKLFRNTIPNAIDHNYDMLDLLVKKDKKLVMELLEGNDEVSQKWLDNNK